ncbi:MAG: serine/threonine protein kinase [Deltaproteobacteria bacterium]|nr:serine/threonine protein kinase [Deltaproteobacteria bacterium]
MGDRELQTDSQHFFALTPEEVLHGVEASGARATGRCLQLNSYENRVYDVEIEEGTGPLEHLEKIRAVIPVMPNRLVAKFYRPGRWTREQILEEHAFLNDLVENEIPAIPAIPFADGETLRASPGSGIVYALFPKVGGRSPDELNEDQLRQVGRLIGRIHNIGSKRTATHRLELTPKTYGERNLDFLLKGDWIPLPRRSRYAAAVQTLCALSGPLFASAKMIRTHGDCHKGNLLWTSSQSSGSAFFLDFDDMVTAPAVQDLWMLVPGRDALARDDREILLEGYEEMRAFDRTESSLIEPLRALRIVHFSTWIANRWNDPSFPRVFPSFNSERYWEEETQALEDIVAHLAAPGHDPDRGFAAH